MPTLQNAYSLNTIADLMTLDGTVNQETVTVLGYYSTNDGGGGDFYWDAGNTDTANGGTIFQGATPAAGRWKRIFDNFIDVKWFGAKGDGVQDDRSFIQNALNFIEGFIKYDNYALYISKGNYRITTPASGAALTFNAASLNNIDIYGDGASQSVLTYSPISGHANIDCDLLKIEAPNFDKLTEISNFSIVGSESYLVGKGLSLQKMAFVSVRNINIYWFDRGIHLVDTLTSDFINVFTHTNNVGLLAEIGVAPAPNSPPNLLGFYSCIFGNNKVYGMEISQGHSTTIMACSIESNGLGEGEVSDHGGIYYSFSGVNGANGLNVTNSYFEGNKGLADIRMENSRPGTHSFIGNTFNRTNVDDFTENNILIDCTGQSPKPNFGFNQCKLVFQGNGFLAANSYVPSASRKTIEISSPNYWDFDIVEEGNVYTGVVDAPVFDSNTPQISEHTRVKAFARISADGTLISSYNIRAVEIQSDNSYRVYFANDLSNPYVTSLTLVGQIGFMFTATELPGSVTVVAQNTSGVGITSRFSIVVF